MALPIQLTDRLRGWQPLALAGICLIAQLLLASAADAHGKSVSYSSWNLAGPEAGVYEVSVRISRLELTRIGLAGSDDPTSIREAGNYLASRLSLHAGDVACEAMAPPKPLRARDGWMSFRLTLKCPEQKPLVIESAILLEAAPSHLHFARLRIAQAGDAASSDQATFEKVLTGREPRWTLTQEVGEESPLAQPISGSSFGRYVSLGIEHILSGWDHLAFVIALLLLARSLREVLWLVSGFTLAHSVTLALAVLGVLHPDPPAVEAVIGFSVALVALENGWELAGRDRRIPLVLTVLLLAVFGLSLSGYGALSSLSLAGLLLFSLCHFGLLARVADPARVRVALAFCFGLVHGFGFAGVLEEMALPTERLVPALLGFNVGVELGQLGVVLLSWPILRALTRVNEGRSHRAIAELASAGICGLGLYWFIVRTLG